MRVPKVDLSRLKGVASRFGERFPKVDLNQLKGAARQFGHDVIGNTARPGYDAARTQTARFKLGLFGAGWGAKAGGGLYIAKKLKERRQEKTAAELDGHKRKRNGRLLALLAGSRIGKALMLLGGFPGGSLNNDHPLAVAQQATTFLKHHKLVGKVDFNEVPHLAKSGYKPNFMRGKPTVHIPSGSVAATLHELGHAVNHRNRLGSAALSGSRLLPLLMSPAVFLPPKYRDKLKGDDPASTRHRLISFAERHPGGVMLAANAPLLADEVTATARALAHLKRTGATAALRKAYLPLGLGLGSYGFKALLQGEAAGRLNQYYADKPQQEKTAARKSPFKVLKENRVPLTTDERAQAMARKAVWHHGPDGGPSPAVWKSVNGDKTTYVTNTHRAYNTAPTLQGAIRRFHRFIKTTA